MYNTKAQKLCYFCNSLINVQSCCERCEAMYKLCRVSTYHDSNDYSVKTHVNIFPVDMTACFHFNLCLCIVELHFLYNVIKIENKITPANAIKMLKFYKSFK